MRRCGYMMLVWLCAAAAIADVDTKDGTAITTTSDMDGTPTNHSKADGQTITGGGAAWPADAFVFTITIAGADTFTLPLRSGYTYDCTNDWGDGSAVSIITAYDDPDITHSYTNAGTFTNILRGTMEAWYFNNGVDKTLFRTVEQWGDININAAGMYRAFYGCTEATTFASPIPVEWAAVSTLQATWRSCIKATSVPDISALTELTTLRDAWNNCVLIVSFPDVNTLTKVASLYTTWNTCQGATVFPDVDALTNVTSIRGAWYQCNSATEFPDVDTLTNVVSMQATWFGCTSTTNVPALPTASVALTTTTDAFDNIGAGMGGAVEALWDTNNFPNITAFGGAFTGATGLDNYADIPDGWKGL